MNRLTQMALWALPLLVGSGVGLADEGKPRAAGRTDPPGAPLEARLVARQATYVLDRGGQSAEDYRKRLEAAPYPPPPRVDLVLELHNRGDHELTFLIGPDGAEPKLTLTGTGAVNVSLGWSAAGRSGVRPRQVTLAPGKVFTWPIKDLASLSLYNEQFQAYWTDAGDYLVDVTLPTAVRPAPKGAKGVCAGFGNVTVTSSAVRLKVVEKK
jgi:hypothetical protein